MKKYRDFAEWGRSGGRMKSRRLLKSRISKREQSMLALRDSGITLQEIGDRHGISRERVRQIIQRARAKK